MFICGYKRSTTYSLADIVAVDAVKWGTKSDKRLVNFYYYQVIISLNTGKREMLFATKDKKKIKTRCAHIHNFCGVGPLISSDKVKLKVL